jgi:hypothetical protein
MIINVDQKIINKIIKIIIRKIIDIDPNNLTCFITYWVDNTYKLELRHGDPQKDEIHRFILCSNKDKFIYYSIVKNDNLKISIEDLDIIEEEIIEMS